MTEETARIEEHKRLFEQWLSQMKSNSKLISQVDLQAVKTYLIAQRDGTTTADIDQNLKRRIKNNKYRVAAFPGDINTVCTSDARSQVSCYLYTRQLSQYVQCRR